MYVHGGCATFEVNLTHIAIYFKYNFYGKFLEINAIEKRFIKAILTGSEKKITL